VGRGEERADKVGTPSKDFEKIGQTIKHENT
jgi:hypothetical protein